MKKHRGGMEKCEHKWRVAWRGDNSETGGYSAECESCGAEERPTVMNDEVVRLEQMLGRCAEELYTMEMYRDEFRDKYFRKCELSEVLRAENERLRELLRGLFGTVCGTVKWERRWPNISRRVRDELDGSMVGRAEQEKSE